MSFDHLFGRPYSDFRNYRWSAWQIFTPRKTGMSVSKNWWRCNVRHWWWQWLVSVWQENRGLQNSNEDLNAQLMNRCVTEGKSLLQDNAKSLAEELDHLTKEEVSVGLSSFVNLCVSTYCRLGLICSVISLSLSLFVSFSLFSSFSLSSVSFSLFSSFSLSSFTSVCE